MHFIGYTFNTTGHFKFILLNFITMNKIVSFRFSFAQIFSEVVRFNDAESTYEYDNSSTPLGRGGFGTVYEGILS